MELKVTFLYVGHGDCAVVTFDEEDKQGGTRNACIVVDGGAYKSSKETLLKYLKKEKIKTIDLLVATHIDQDHIQGLNYLLKDIIGNKCDIELKNYWGPAPEDWKPMDISTFISCLMEMEGVDENLSFLYQSVKQNEDLNKYLNDEHIMPVNIEYPSVENLPRNLNLFKNVKLEIFGPDKQIPSSEIKKLDIDEYVYEMESDEVIDLNDEHLKERIRESAIKNRRNANNQSIVFKLTPAKGSSPETKEFTFLFAGDAEEESWDLMVERNREKLRSKVLKVAHHASTNGTTLDGFEAVSPKYCIVSTGKNTHGLPDENALKLIKKQGAKIFCTGRNSKKKKSRKTKVGPCIGEDVLEMCPKFDKDKGKDIPGEITFKIDTDTGTMEILPDDKWCGFDWSK